MPDRISRKQLEDILPALTDRDKDILRSVRACRYLTTGQIGRLHFTESTTASAALRAASRNLSRLKDWHLIDRLRRRIGGVRAGSGANVWYLDAPGEHLLRLVDNDARPHKKNFEPSTYFLKHTLAAAECYVRLIEVSRSKSIQLTEIQPEPACWRTYNSGGKIISLKPDLFAVTICGGYENRWFFEMDLASESPAKIIDKCHRYYQYYQCNFEQKLHGVFPLVVWIVPDAKRKENIAEHIRKEFSKWPNIFTIITPDGLESLIRRGATNTEGGE